LLVELLLLFMKLLISFVFELIDVVEFNALVAVNNEFKCFSRLFFLISAQVGQNHFPFGAEFKPTQTK
jgi:hypothetical protein